MTFSIFLLSAAVLAHEVCLLRILSLAYWHHAASLVVSVALLGFGAAGTLLAVAPALKRRRSVAACCGLYALLIPLSLRTAAAIDFNILEVGWNPRQWLRLLALEATFFLPFLVAAFGIAVALALRARNPGRIYAANLLGSGVGALAVPLLLDLGPPAAVLTWVAVAAALAALPRLPLWAAGAALGALLLGGPGLPMSAFKDWPLTPGKTNITTTHGPLGRVDAADVASLHFAPGLAPMARAFPENQRGLFLDGHLVAAKDLAGSEYLDETVGALPFAVSRPRRVLLLGVGPDLPRATTVVDVNPRLLAAAGVEGVARDPRAFLEETQEEYDLVVHHVPSLHAAAETPLVTVEGLTRAFAVGEVAVSCSLATPPRAGLKLLATAEKVTPFLVAVRSPDRLCVWLRRRAPTPEEEQRVLAFCEDKGLDPVRPLAWRLADPHYETSTPLLPAGPDYPYDVRPATDVRPYFFKFFRWSRLGDLFDPDQISFVQWPYVALMVALVQVVVLGFLLLAGPLVASRAARAPAPLFLALGLGFMLLEMAFLQRAMVRLGSPVHAAAAVLGGFLLGSGCGSLVVERLGRPLRRAALGVAVLAPLGYLFLPASLAAATLACAVVAFPMGMPFPAALSGLEPPRVPWALAWNGCASVAAASAAPLLSSTFGIPATAGAALLLYLLVAAFAVRRSAR